MADNELLLKIGGDPTQAQSALDAIKAKAAELVTALEENNNATEGLFQLEALKSIGDISEKGFEKVRGAIDESVAAFTEANTASLTLTNSLQNQGIYTDELKDSYDEYAESVSELTGVQKDQLTQSQAILQSYIHQLPVTEELTQAVADLAAGTGKDLASAATDLGRAIESGTGSLKRQGLAFKDNETEAQRMADILQFVNVKYKDFAAAQDEGSLGAKDLATALQESREELGERFAPAVAFINGLLADFIRPAKESSGILTDLKAGLLAGAAAVTALGVALPLVAQGFVAVRAAAIALEIGAAPLLLIPVAIGAIVAALVVLALNWETVSARVKLIVQGLVTFISGSFGGLAKIFQGAMSLSTDKVKEGMAEIQKAFSTGYAQATATAVKATEDSEEKQDAIKEGFAKKDLARRQRIETTKQNLEKAQQQKALLQASGASQSLIHLKEQEIQILEQMQKTTDEKQLDALQKKYDQLLEKESRYGDAYRALQEKMNSDEIKGAEKATSSLVGLANSKNATLKAIGKAAAISQITIRTAKGAMEAYEGFMDAIPFPPVAIPLGIAAAAAVVAYGAEQIADVTAAADGGILTGGIPGKDSVPMLGMPGELVVPTKNFEEVVGATRAARQGTQNGGSGMAEVQLTLKDGLMDFIEAKIVQRKRLNLSILGAT